MTESTRDVISNITSLGSASSAARGKKSKDKGQIGQDEFLTLLVQQLKAQDPLNPMNNEEFAVNLAQFSQLEQLISINEKFDAASNSSVSSLAGLLGQEVTLKRETVMLNEDSASALRVNAPTGTQSLTVSFKNQEGGVVDSIEVPVTQSGAQRIDLKGLTQLEGEFGFSVSANTGSGAQVPLKASVVGTVTGFIPGPESVLILDGGEEVQLKEIKRVDVPITTS